MAAVALLLNVRLAKPGVYALNAGGRGPLPGDTARAAALGQKSVFACAGCALAVIFAKAALGIAS
jgi:adenosylcobinamide-phosphate synthase